ncbi:MAG: radical SAM protein [Deltaproteobacteria bacterium]|nr:radical SAM protein [Deltaproteobacteria bacterium]
MTTKYKLYNAVIEITNRCNLRCPHCASTSGTQRENELDFDKIKKILHEIKYLGGREITLIGGEIFLRSDWYKICQVVNELEMRLVLVSNGILINKKIRQQLKTLQPYLIGISLDGSTAQSYLEHRGVDKFEQVLQLLYQLKEDGHKEVNAITTFMRSNLSEFEQFIELFNKQPITWQVQIANLGGNRFKTNNFFTQQDYKIFCDKMKKAFRDCHELKLKPMCDYGYYPLEPELYWLHKSWHGCLAGTHLIGIQSDGKVRGCLSLDPHFNTANLQKQSLTEIWTSNKFFYNFRNKINYLEDNCKNCSQNKKCKAGCTSIAFSVTGKIGSNPYCIRSMESEKLINKFAD